MNTIIPPTFDSFIDSGYRYARRLHPGGEPCAALLINYQTPK